MLDRMNYDFSPIQKELTELYACGFPSPYTIQETAAVFQLYLELFEASTGGVHPPIGKIQVRRIAAKMPYFEGSTISENRPADILPDAALDGTLILIGMGYAFLGLAIGYVKYQRKDMY